MTRLVHAVPVVLISLLASLCGCNPEPGKLIPEPPPPPEAHDETAPPAFPVIPPPVREAAVETPEEQNPKEQNLRKLPAPPDPAWIAGNPRKWTHIIIHHSATDFGNAATFDRLHRERSWDELGYHFVITNGNGGNAGKVEVGPRWVKQKHGAHCRPDPNDNNYWNEHGIGVCLVGDFTRHKPGEAQLASAAQLISFLMRQSGIPARNILGHGQVAGAKTACPGAKFPYADLFRRIADTQK